MFERGMTMQATTPPAAKADAGFPQRGEYRIHLPRWQSDDHRGGNPLLAKTGLHGRFGNCFEGAAVAQRYAAKIIARLRPCAKLRQADGSAVFAELCIE